MDPAPEVYLEVGKRRVFACALDWPGWCRSGKDEQGAVETLLAYAPRYAAVAAVAGLPFPAGCRSVEVVDRIAGGATTDFGAPEKPAGVDAAGTTKKQRSEQLALLEAAWEVFDAVVSAAPAALRRGPRGGGRDRDAISDHVVSAELAYARKLGIETKVSGYAAREQVLALRRAIGGVLASATTPGPLLEKGWPVRYAARRIAWHVVDHAWEIEDRSS